MEQKQGPVTAVFAMLTVAYFPQLMALGVAHDEVQFLKMEQREDMLKLEL